MKIIENCMPFLVIFSKIVPKNIFHLFLRIKFCLKINLSEKTDNTKKKKIQMI